MAPKNDGVSLTSMVHPRPKGLGRRFVSWLKCLRGISELSIETVVIHVKGNCGRTHASVEEWQKCEACKYPQPLKPYWKD